MKSKIHEHKKNSIKLVSKKLLFLPALLLAFTSCETTDVVQNQITPTASTAHVYTVGNGINGAYLIKDGVTTNLVSDYFVTDVYAIGNDVYTCGKYYSGGVIYTKNGVVTVLDSSAEDAHSILINGNDVYVTGTKDDHAVYWKNGVVTILNNETNFKSVARGISISNNNVYIAGYKYDPSFSGIPVNFLTWKNNVETDLGQIDGDFNAILVNNNDIYLPVTKRTLVTPGGCGNCPSAVYRNDAYMIKNGVHNLIKTGASINDIFASGADIYYCGATNSSFNGVVGTKATIWKNGIEVYSSTNNSAFQSVFVSNNNLFAVGNAGVSTGPFTFDYYAASLINNVFTTQTVYGVNSYNRAIFVTE